MKVAQFLPYFPPHKGGLETVAEEFSTHFVGEGKGEVLNVVFSVGQKSLQRYEQKGYNIWILPAFDLIPNYPFPKFRTRQFRSVLAEVKRRNPEIIQTHTRFFLSTFLGGLCAKLWKKKWVHVEHGSGLVKGLSRWKGLLSNCYDYTLGRLCLDMTDLIVTISQGNIPFIRSLSKKPITVIYRGIDFPTIIKKNKKSDSIIIGFVGRLVKLKGVDLLIQVFARLKEKFPTIRLEIVGDGEEKLELMKQTTKLELDEFVTFYGFQDTTKIQSDFLPSFDIFVNPSLQEGLPTTVIEALLAECVVVATDVGGTREISSGEDLILVNSNDKDSLQDGLERAIKNYKRLIGYSKIAVRKQFDREHTVDCFANHYASLLGK